MTLETLKHLRDDYDDDNPEQKAYGNFKARRGWWQSLIFALEDTRETLILDDLRPKIDEFIAHFTSEEFHQQPLTTAEDIGRANNLLDKIISDHKSTF